MILAMVVFSTTSGISLNVHFCKGKVKNFAFFTEAEACAKGTTTTQEPTCRSVSKCDNHSGVSRTQCCLDEAFFYKLSTESHSGSPSVVLPDFTFSPSIAHFSRSFFSNSGRASNYSINDPPFIDITIPALYQVFRI